MQNAEASSLSLCVSAGPPPPPDPATRGGAVPPTALFLAGVELSAPLDPGRTFPLSPCFLTAQSLFLSRSVSLFLSPRLSSLCVFLSLSLSLCLSVSLSPSSPSFLLSLPLPLSLWGGGEEEEFFPRLTFQGTQFTPSLFPFQAAAERPSTHNSRAVAERGTLSTSNSPSPSLPASSRYLHLHLHLRHPPPAAPPPFLLLSSSSPPPPLFLPPLSLFGSCWTSGVGGGSGGSLSSSSPQRAPARPLSPPLPSPALSIPSPERCWADPRQRRPSGCSGGTGGGSGSGGGRQDERTR